ncbi:unnamed protein product [Effrenium voratum]|uniref:Uncharacterized protein n=1 Tax=Effrenium voratum TaxID=2562239 RepID=A0AA36MRS0_9DINO|nr:unnamed protein product [Effrenium voratum]
MFPLAWRPSCGCLVPGPAPQPRMGRRAAQKERPFRPLGYGNGKRESTTFAGWSNCYLGCNDPYGETLHSILSLVRAKYLTVDRFVSVVGSFVALQFLLVLKPKALHFFDMNPQQVLWAKMLCELIAISQTPQEFISRVFARPVRGFERRLGSGGFTGERLTHLNQHRFLRLAASKRWRDSTLQRLSASGRATYREVLMPLQEDEKPGWFTPQLLPCEDRRRFRAKARTGLGPQGRLPGDRFASMLYGEGWLTNQQTFHLVKCKLARTPITWTAGIDFTGAAPEDLIQGEERSRGERTLLFAMDMWSSHFARPLPRQSTLRWRNEGRLVAVQSITAEKHELVQELVGSDDLRWRSLSEWDSGELLPPHICQVGEVLHEGCRLEPGLGDLDAHPLLAERHCPGSQASFCLLSRRVLVPMVTFRCGGLCQSEVPLFGLTTMEETLHQQPACADAVVELLRLAGQSFGATAVALALPMAIASLCLACAAREEEEAPGGPVKLALGGLNDSLRCEG